VELSALYNEISGGVPAKFTSLDEALGAVKGLKKVGPKKASKCQVNRHYRGFVRLPRKGGVTRQLIGVLNRPGGATVNEIATIFGWTIIKAYNAVRLLHEHKGYGIVTDPLTRKIRIHTDKKEK